jgi:ammonia channel protein AmtB
LAGVAALSWWPLLTHAAVPSVGSAKNGFVRGRNVFNTLMMSFGLSALLSVVWVVAR